MPDVLNQTSVSIKGNNRYILLLCPMKDACTEGFDGSVNLK